MLEDTVCPLPLRGGRGRGAVATAAAVGASLGRAAAGEVLQVSVIYYPRQYRW